ncbi:MAG: ribbon-helix-helix protein, CopG family [Peptostreptococcaceae bacterium]|nr:ribbon-helix-helix protein, CopG family [Peptostreptococcaceae bacterium]MDY5739257.1 ribbon-helix-helix protein, CopG family [Anaerovoracaceae bacterium]
MSNKKLVPFRLSEELDKKIKKEAEAKGISKTAIIEEALDLYFKELDEERLANILLDKIDEKYGKKLNLKLRAMDINIEVILELLNSLAHSLKDKNAINDFISIDDLESPIVSQAKLAVNKKIANQKQRKDYRKKGE